MPEPGFVRVKDKLTGHHYSVRPGSVLENHAVLKNERAEDANGRALPPKYNLNQPKTTTAPAEKADAEPKGATK